MNKTNNSKFQQMKSKSNTLLNLLIPAILILIGCSGNQKLTETGKKNLEDKKEILLIGTFHFNDPNLDVAKTKPFNILSREAQTELDEIAQKIKEFNPSKIFVEWDNNKQEKLDSLYQLYLKDEYFKEGQSRFYKEGEIFQLAFRTAKKCKHLQVYGIDIDAEFPYDSVMTVIGMHNQVELKKELEDGINKLVTGVDDIILRNESLKEILYYHNRKDIRELDNHVQIETMMLVGDRDNFIGPYLASEWIRRNIYMWSVIQKLSKKDERVMVLLGASHIAVIKDFIDKNQNWNSVELKSIIK